MRKYCTGKTVRYKSLTFLGYPKYRVGDDGSVWSCCNNRHGIGRWKRKKLTDGRDHLVVGLWNEGKTRVFLVHHLVLFAFIGPQPQEMECCHNDGDFANNKLDNLRWDTRKSNQADRIRHGTTVVGRVGNSCKLSRDEVDHIRKLYRWGICTVRQLASRYSVTMPTIYYHLNKSLLERIIP